jgi:hypothetical protein
MGLDTKTYWLTGRQSQCDFHFDFDLTNSVSQTRVEAGSNTSTVTLRVVGGDEKGSLKSETGNTVASPKRLGPEKDCAGKASRTYKRQTRPLVREGAPRKQERNCQTEINIWSWAPDGSRYQDLLTGWMTVSRNVTLTLTLKQSQLIRVS